MEVSVIRSVFAAHVALLMLADALPASVFQDKPRMEFPAASRSQRRRRRVFYTSVLMLLGVSPNGTAATLELAHTFQNETPSSRDFFGTSVVLEGSVAAIKSHSGYLDFDSFSITQIFEQGADGGWTREETLLFDAGRLSRGNPYLGLEIDIDGGEVAISYGPQFDTSPRQAIQFATRDASGWSVELNEPTPTQSEFASYSGRRLLGRSVGISANRAIVEHVDALRPDGGRGVVRIFEKSESDGLWREAANLAPQALIEAGSRGEFLPFSVAIDGSTAAFVDRGLNNEGGLYFFEQNESGEWEEAQSFTRDEGDNRFLQSVVEIDGGIAVNRELVGPTTVYEKNLAGVWEESTQLPISDALGFDIALEGDLLAGPLESDGGGVRRVGVFRRTAQGEWWLVSTVSDPAPGPNSAFGTSVAINEGRLLVGAGTDSLPNNTPGAAYLFVPTALPGDFNGDGVVDAIDYTVWRDSLGTRNPLGDNGVELGASAGVVDEVDYELWRDNFGATASAASNAAAPEPSAAMLLACFSANVMLLRNRRRRLWSGRATRAKNSSWPRSLLGREERDR